MKITRLFIIPNHADPKCIFFEINRFLLLAVLLVSMISQPANGDIFNIEDYGAVAGGGSDSNAFEAAFSAASAGDTVMIPAGNFQITNSIIPKAGVILAGAGRDSSTIQYIGTTTNFLIRLRDSSNNIELTGFTLDGLNGEHAGDGISVGGTHGHYIHDLRVRNLISPSSQFGSHGIYAVWDMDDSRIENNEFLDIGKEDYFGGGIRLAAGSENNLIVNNTVRNTGRGGIFLDHSTDNIIRNNTISGSGLAKEGLGIEVWGESHRAIVEDNNIDHWLSIDSSNFVAVRRNTVTATDGTVKFIGVELAGGSDIIITNNTVGRGNQIGFSVSNSVDKKRVYVAGNTFSTSETWGSQIQDNGGETRQFYLYNNTFTDAENDGDEIYDAKTMGFRFNATSGGAGIRQFVFDSNKIIDNDEIGLLFGGVDQPGGGIDEFSFIDNTITGNGTRGIENGDKLELKNLDWGAGNNVSGNGSNNGGLTSHGFTNNDKPTASILTDDDDLVVNQGQLVNFGFLYTDDGDAQPAEVLWDFDEGLPVVDYTPAHTFNKPGVYTVALVAWDSQGRAAHHRLQVTVQPVPEPSAMLLLGIGNLMMLCLRRRFAK